MYNYTAVGDNDAWCIWKKQKKSFVEINVDNKWKIDKWNRSLALKIVYVYHIIIDKFIVNVILKLSHEQIDS